MKAISRGVCVAVGGLPYLLPVGSLSPAYFMVAGSSHRRLEAWPSDQLKGLLSTWKTAGESTNVLPAKSLARLPLRLMTHVPQFSPRGSFSSIQRIRSLACCNWERLVRILFAVTIGQGWPSKPVTPA